VIELIDINKIFAPDVHAEAIFVTNLVAIMTKICMADGHISKEERNKSSDSRRIQFH
jgi:hypothetical protein